MFKKEAKLLAGGLGMTLMTAAIWHGAVITERLHQELDGVEDTTARKFNAGQPLSLLIGGVATLDLKDGQLVRITNPLVYEGQRGDVIALERNPDHANKDEIAKGFYSVAGGIFDTMTARSLSFKIHGHKISRREALSKSQSAKLAFNKFGQFVVAAGQEHAGTVVGQGEVVNN